MENRIDQTKTNDRTINKYLDSGNDTAVFKATEVERKDRKVMKLWQGKNLLSIDPETIYDMAKWYQQFTKEAIDKLQSFKELYGENFLYHLDPNYYLDNQLLYVDPVKIDIEILPVTAVKRTMENGKTKNVFTSSPFACGDQLFKTTFTESEVWKKSDYKLLLQELIYNNLLHIDAGQLDDFNIKYKQSEDGRDKLIITDLLGEIDIAYTYRDSK